jgi:hypothetical protein
MLCWFLFFGAKTLLSSVYAITLARFFRCVSCSGGDDGVEDFAATFFSLAMKKAPESALAFAVSRLKPELVAPPA